MSATDFTALSRSQWLDLAARFYAHLALVLEGLAPSDWGRTTPYFGWSAADVLAHMTSAMPVNFRQMLDRAIAGQPGAPPEFDTFNRNAREVARRRTRPPGQVLAEFRAELEQITGTYRAISDADWLKPAWFFVGPVKVRTLFLVQFADNVFHERDLLVVNGRWKGLNPEWSAPLMDWFMREFRPATFRPERAAGVRAVVVYRLHGPAGGEWTMQVADGTCTTRRGGDERADVTVEASVEDLVVGALGRAPPWVGRAARLVDWVRGPARAEDVVAGITGRVSLLSALLARRLRVSGDRRVSSRLTHAFWHFWERTRQTEANIRRG